MKLLPNIRVAALMAAGALVACGESAPQEEQNTDPHDSETVPPPPPDTESETETALPELPDLCKAEVETIAGSETTQFPLSGPGSADLPGLAVRADTGDGLFAYTYIDGDLDGWETRTAAYRTAAGDEDAGLGVVREIGDTVSPAAAPPGAKSTAIAAGANGFLAIRYDGRFNEACTPQTIDTCKKDVVSLLLDEDGTAAGEPIVISDETQGHPTAWPAATALPDGFLAVWPTAIDGAVHLAAVRLDNDGRPVGAPRFVTDAPVDAGTGPVAASGSSTAVIVFTSASQNGIFAVVWPHEDSGPREDIVPLSETATGTRRGTVAAGPGGFLTGWLNPGGGDGAEIATRRLDAEGDLAGEIHRVTWAKNIDNPSLAAREDTYAVAFSASGLDDAGDCAVPDWCADQIFVTLLNEDGEAVAEPVRLTKDPNDSRSVRLAWDGIGWTAVWQTWRLNRWQLFYGQMTCE